MKFDANDIARMRGLDALRQIMDESDWTAEVESIRRAARDKRWITFLKAARNPLIPDGVLRSTAERFLPEYLPQVEVVLKRRETGSDTQDQIPHDGHSYDGEQLHAEGEGVKDDDGTDTAAPKKPRLEPLDLQELFGLDLKRREMVLDPIIPEKGLVMLYAPRGTGKTLVADGIAYAAATGTKLLKWEAPKARHVLLVDGEMPAIALRERLEQIVGASTKKPELGFLKIISGDLIEDGGVGNLADRKIQVELDQYLDGIDLLILDNLSSLTAVIRDNDAESWTPVQTWILGLRRRGISVLIVHHAGKGGGQRGTSRREDILDTSISLRRPIDYQAVEGARFEVHIEKGRGIHGDGAKPFEAKLENIGGKSIWTVRTIEDVNQARVAALLDDGLSVREIAEETGLSKSVVGRLKVAIEAGKRG